MPNHGPMACPVDGTALVMSERSGIEIDYCPSCRGVWLDRGELDKIIERNESQQGVPPAGAPQAAPPPPQGAPGVPYGQQPYGHQPPYGHDPHYGHKHYKRRKSFLEELFD